MTVTKLVGVWVRRIEKACGRDALVLVSLALVCLVFSGCAGPKPGTTTSGEEPRLPSAEVDIRGIVTEVRRMPQENSGGGGGGSGSVSCSWRRTPTKKRGPRRTA